MGLSIAQLPPLTPTSNENSFNTAATAADFKVFGDSVVKAASTTVGVDDAFISVKQHIVAKADSIDYFLADVMPTGAL